MKRMIGWASRLYPARWRARYGAEFAALVEDCRPSWRDVWDVARGAAKMRVESIAWWQAAALFVGGAALFGATLLPALLPKTWMASGETRIAIRYARTNEANRDLTEQFLNTAMAQLVGSETLGRGRIDVVERLNLYPDLRARYGSDGMKRFAESELASNLHYAPSIAAAGEGEYVLTFPIRFAYSDARKAEQVVKTLLPQVTQGGAKSIRATYPFVTAQALGTWVGVPELVPPDRLRLAYVCGWFGLALWLLARYPKAFLFTVAGGVIAQRFQWYLSSPGSRICLVLLGLAVGFALSRLPLWPRRRAAL